MSTTSVSALGTGKIFRIDGSYPNLHLRSVLPILPHFVWQADIWDSFKDIFFSYILTTKQRQHQGIHFNQGSLHSPICQDQCGLGRWRNECLSITGAIQEKYQGRDDQIAEVLLFRIIHAELLQVDFGAVIQKSSRTIVDQLFLRVMK